MKTVIAAVYKWTICITNIKNALSFFPVLIPSFIQKLKLYTLGG